MLKSVLVIAHFSRSKNSWKKVVTFFFVNHVQDRKCIKTQANTNLTFNTSFEIVLQQQMGSHHWQLLIVCSIYLTIYMPVYVYTVHVLLYTYIFYSNPSPNFSIAVLILNISCVFLLEMV